MKRKLAAILLITTVVLSGCSSKGLNGSSAQNNSAQTQSSSGADASDSQRVQVQTNFAPVKPGTVPQLSGVQKAQVNTKMNSTLKDLDNTLKSIQDGQDVNVN